MFAKIEQQIKEQIQAQSIPGFSMVVVQDQEVIYSNGFGITNREEDGVPVTSNTLFRIGSLSKPLTATAIMVLVDKGLLNLDLPIKEYVPHFELQDKGAAEIITLRMLLNHSAGIQDGTDLIGSRDVTALEHYFLREVPTLSMVAPPGLIFSYSNHHLNIAGYVAEFVYGKYFPELMKEVLFNPLGMSRTVYDPLLAMTYSVALGHERTEQGDQVVRPFYENAANYPSWFAMSTVADYAKFLILHLNQGRFEDRSILSPAATEEMQTKQVNRYNLNQLGCGTTFITEKYHGFSTIRHGGAIGTYTCFMLAVPEKKLAIVTMASQDYGIDLAYEVMDTLLTVKSPDLKPQSIQPDVNHWERFTGSYLGNISGLARIFVEGENLTLDLNGQEMTLHAFDEDVYFAKDPEENAAVTIGFAGNLDEKIEYIVVDGHVCKRIDSKNVLLPQAEWTPLTGSYSNGAISFDLQEQETSLYLIDEEEYLVCTPLFGQFFYTEKHGLLEIREVENTRMMILQDNWKLDKTAE